VVQRRRGQDQRKQLNMTFPWIVEITMPLNRVLFAEPLLSAQERQGGASARLADRSALA